MTPADPPVSLAQMNEAPLDAITHAIQLAVTPVFLMAGVAGILSVLAHRLARIVDRGRILHERVLRNDNADPLTTGAELRLINQRMWVVNTAICLCTLCALLICAVVAVIFLGAISARSLAGIISYCFVAAMVCLIVALLAFLVEVYLATVKSPLRR